MRVANSSSMTLENSLKAELNSPGWFVLESVYTPEETDLVLASIYQAMEENVGHLYKDRAGRLRRMEYVAFYNDIMKNLNKRFQDILYEATGEQWSLFKDKVNFKPSGGEGFYAHYDGIFEFINPNGGRSNGWYEYTNCFISSLLLLDDFTEINGAMELSDKHDEDWDTLYGRTKQNGTPDIREDLIDSYDWTKIIAPKGSVLIFDHRVPHMSRMNKSESTRRTIYYTYNPVKAGDFYEKYFSDKYNSKNTNSKSLSGELI